MKRGLILATLFAALVARAPTAWACTCSAQTPAEHFKAASVVFVGAVAALDAAPSRATRATFSVDAVHKGDTTENVLIETPRDGASCGVTFVTGQRWVVFASVARGVASTNICNGTTQDMTTLAKAGKTAPLRTFDHTSGLASPSIDPKASSGDGGARAGALAAAAVLLVLSAATLVMRARRKPLRPAG